MQLHNNSPELLKTMIVLSMFYLPYSVYFVMSINFFSLSQDFEYVTVRSDEWFHSQLSRWE